MLYGIEFRNWKRVAIAHIGIARIGTSRNAIGIFDGDITAGGRGGIRNVGGIAIQRGSLVSGGDDSRQRAISNPTVFAVGKNGRKHINRVSGTKNALIP
jgi:hypothetical protein